jgi:hypothetical protein
VKKSSFEIMRLNPPGYLDSDEARSFDVAFGRVNVSIPRRFGWRRIS